MKLSNFIQQQSAIHQELHSSVSLKSDIHQNMFNRIIYQKIFNKICKEEINTLAQATNEANIRIVFMKGLIIAENLYSPPEKRLFGDIDLLLNIYDLKKFLEICKKLGYNFLFMETNETIQKGIERSVDSKMHHYYEISKIIYCNETQIDIKIEAHTHIYSDAFHQIEIPYNAITNSVLNSSIMFNCYGFENIYILNKYDDLLALIVHTVKHFFETIMESMKCNNYSHFFKMQQLMDIVLFIEKYNMDYNILLNRAIKWNVISELVFMCKIIQTYKTDEFREINLDKAYKANRRKVGFVAYYIDLFIQNFDNLFELLLLPSWNLAKYIVDYRPNIECPIITCHKEDEYYSQQGGFIIDEQSDIINNRFGTHHMDGRQTVPPNYWHCQGSTRWTEEYLFFKFKVKSSYKLNLKNKSCKGWMPTDSIDLYFLKSNNNDEKQRFIRQIEIPLQIDDNPDSILYGKPFIKVFDAEFKYSNGRQGKYIMWDIESFVYNFEISENKRDYVLEVGFKWDMLQDCISNNEIIFDIGMVTFDDIPPRRNILTWASPMCYSDFHDITTFGCLKIANEIPPICLE